MMPVDEVTATKMLLQYLLTGAFERSAFATHTGGNEGPIWTPHRAAYRVWHAYCEGQADGHCRAFVCGAFAYLAHLSTTVLHKQVPWWFDVTAAAPIAAWCCQCGRMAE